MAQAQVGTGTATLVPADQGAITATLAPTLPPDQLSITWPVPVTELWSSVEVRGTANIPNMARYTIEVANLPADLVLPPDAVWMSISEQSQPVRDGVLATLDSTTIPDGLYALRLTAFDTAGQSFPLTITPLRVSNERFKLILQGTRTPTRRPITAVPRTRTPVPTVVLNGIALNPANPTCGQTYTVQVNVNNRGTTNSAPGTVTVQDINVRTGDITASGTGNFPAIAPGQNSVVSIQLASSLFYNEVHQVRAFIANSVIAATYTLQQGTCNVTLTPSQTATGAPPTTVPTTAVPPTTAPTTIVPTTVVPTTAAPSATTGASPTTGSTPTGTQAP
jgi:hypothetical protein